MCVKGANDTLKTDKQCVTATKKNPVVIVKHFFPNALLPTLIYKRDVVNLLLSSAVPVSVDESVSCGRTDVSCQHFKGCGFTCTVNSQQPKTLKHTNTLYSQLKGGPREHKSRTRTDWLL